FSGQGENPYRRYASSDASPRAPELFGVSRAGERPAPTVTVRMKESSAVAVSIWRPRSALIYWLNSQRRKTMNQTTKKIAYIQAGWHKEIVEQAYRSFAQT